jgi:hypothetical protein
MPSIFSIVEECQASRGNYSEKSMKGLPSCDKRLVLCEATCHLLRSQQGSNKKNKPVRILVIKGGSYPPNSQGVTRKHQEKKVGVTKEVVPAS